MSLPTDDYLTPQHQALRARIIKHCRWMRQFDADQAERSYNHYRELLPWLNLPPPKEKQ